jgi:hypothetical protein
VNGILPLGSKEDLLDLKWSDRHGFALGVVSELGTKVQEVRDAEEGLGRANLLTRIYPRSFKHLPALLMNINSDLNIEDSYKGFFFFFFVNIL